MNGQLLLIPPLFQALAMLFDEFYYHHKRGLPLWEKIGHPLDTITTISPLLFSLFFSESSNFLAIYISLSVFSCLFIVKDELIHKDLCSPYEMVLHSILFICHPIIFISFYFLMKSDGFILFDFHFTYQLICSTQLIMMAIFLLYQIIFWGFVNGKFSK